VLFFCSIFACALTKYSDCPPSPCEYPPSFNVLLCQCVLYCRYHYAGCAGYHSRIDAAGDCILGVVQPLLRRHYLAVPGKERDFRRFTLLQGKPLESECWCRQMVGVDKRLKLLWTNTLSAGKRQGCMLPPAAYSKCSVLAQNAACYEGSWTSTGCQSFPCS